MLLVEAGETPAALAPAQWLTHLLQCHNIRGLSGFLQHLEIARYIDRHVDKQSHT